MSIDPRIIAKLITEYPDLFNEAHVLSEAVDKRDFFDTQVLIALYGDNTVDKTEVASLLRFYLDELLTSYINDFYKVLIVRFLSTGWVDDDGVRHEDNLDLYESLGYLKGYTGNEEDWHDGYINVGSEEELDEFYNVASIVGTPFGDRVRVLNHISKSNMVNNQAGETWFGFIPVLDKMLRSLLGGDLSRKILVLDKFYGLTHHGGMISDYLEDKYLEYALHDRSFSSVRQMLPYCSSEVRRLARSSTIGSGNTAVDPLERVYTGFLRANSKIRNSNRGARLTSKGLEVFIDVYRGYKTPRLPSDLLGRISGLLRFAGGSLVLSSDFFEDVDIEYVRGMKIMDLAERVYYILGSRQNVNRLLSAQSAGETSFKKHSELPE